MPRLVWKETYAAGIPSLDYEHILLIDVINAGCDAWRNGASADVIADCLASLYERACAHFALEERLMLEARHASRAALKAEHEKLIGAIRDMMDAFDDGLCTRCNQSLDECLVSWFERHIQLDCGRLQGTEPGAGSCAPQ